MSFKVTEVVDGYTFVVSPKWRWRGETGNRVRIANLDAKELSEWGGKAAKERLRKMIEGKTVKLDPVSFSYGRLVCDVFCNRRNVAKAVA